MSQDERDRLLGILFYEVEMLYRVPAPRGDQFETNALVECFLLHARNLIEFFRKPGPKPWDTDVRYTTFLGRGAEEIDIGLREGLQKDISQRMSHMTTHRTRPNIEWEIPTIRRALGEAIREFVDRLDPEWFSGAVAKTKFENLLNNTPPVRWGSVPVSSTSSSIGQIGLSRVVVTRPKLEGK